ncbi:MAG: BrnT family toxin [Candidatus Omnitrophica bacterium]|nr:BrnT family toxin [Candidatus Omnitrophota bacterium]
MLNIEKHGLNFNIAAQAFLDPRRKVFVDSKHSKQEERLFCIGKVDGKIVTVRFTYRNDVIRIYGAGYWRKGKDYYEKENS